MKFVRYGSHGSEFPGVLDTSGNVRDLSKVIHDIASPTISTSAFKGIGAIELESLPLIDTDLRLGPCIGSVGNFIGVGLNYRDHAAEAGLPIPTEPVIFNKVTSCISGPHDNILLPTGSSQTDWEVELAVIIGVECTDVEEHEVDEVIAGYCICNDVSERSFQFQRGGQWVKGKSYPTFGPLGPWLVTPDEIADVQNLDLWLKVNGDLMQRGNTSQMIFSVKFLISYISKFMMLQPGDVVTTGTPAGVGMGMDPPHYLTEGDVVSLGIDCLGAQRQIIKPRNN